MESGDVKIDVKDKKSSIDNGNKKSCQGQTEYKSHFEAMKECQTKPEKCMEVSSKPNEKSTTEDVRKISSI